MVLFFFKSPGYKKMTSRRKKHFIKLIWIVLCRLVYMCVSFKIVKKKWHKKKKKINLGQSIVSVCGWGCVWPMYQYTYRKQVSLTQSLSVFNFISKYICMNASWSNIKGKNGTGRLSCAFFNPLLVKKIWERRGVTCANLSMSSL